MAQSATEVDKRDGGTSEAAGSRQTGASAMGAAVRTQLRGKDFAAQDAMLAPVQHKRSAAPTQHHRGAVQMEESAGDHAPDPLGTGHVGAHAGAHFEGGHVAAEGSVHFDWSFPQETPIGRYIIFKGLGFAGAADWKVTHGPAGRSQAGHEEGGGTSGSVGATTAGGGGIAGSVQHAFADIGEGVRPTLNGGGQITRQGGELAVGISGGRITLGHGVRVRLPSATLNIIKYDNRKSGSDRFTVLEAEINIPLSPEHAFLVDIQGQDVEIKPHADLKLKFGPNLPAIIARFGAGEAASIAAEGGAAAGEGGAAAAEGGAAAAEVGAAAAEGGAAAAESGAIAAEAAAMGGGSVASGVAVAAGLIVIPLVALGTVFAHDIGRSEDIRESSLDAARDLVRFCGAYTDLWVRGEGDGPGAALAMRHIRELQQRVPGVDVRATARDLGGARAIYTRVYDQVKEGVISRLTQQWDVAPGRAEAHYIEGYIANARWGGTYRSRYYRG